MTHELDVSLINWFATFEVHKVQKEKKRAKIILEFLFEQMVKNKLYQHTENGKFVRKLVLPNGNWLFKTSGGETESGRKSWNWHKKKKLVN